MAHINNYEDFVDDLVNKYPKMFPTRDTQISVDRGWWKIIDNLCNNIQSHINWTEKSKLACQQVVVSQIKEKFGGLRFYYDGGDSTVTGMVEMAESWAAHACEVCGDVGTARYNGYIRTLCDIHNDELLQKIKLELD